MRDFIARGLHLTGDEIPEDQIHAAWTQSLTQPATTTPTAPTEGVVIVPACWNHTTTETTDGQLALAI